MTRSAWVVIWFMLGWIGAAPWVISGSSHLVEKLAWIARDGGTGMTPIDVFDVFLHGGAAIGFLVWPLSWRRLAPPAVDSESSG